MNESQVLEELYRALQNPGPDDAMTRREISEALGLGAEAVRKRLRAAKKAGRLQACRVLRENLEGQMQSTPAYRLTGEPE